MDNRKYLLIKTDIVENRHDLKILSIQIVNHDITLSNFKLVFNNEVGNGLYWYAHEKNDISGKKINSYIAILDMDFLNLDNLHETGLDYNRGIIYQHMRNYVKYFLRDQKLSNLL